MSDDRRQARWWTFEPDELLMEIVEPAGLAAGTGRRWKPDEGAGFVDDLVGDDVAVFDHAVEVSERLAARSRGGGIADDAGESEGDPTGRDDGGLGGLSAFGGLGHRHGTE
jgi:hypothetical protein